MCITGIENKKAPVVPLHKRGVRRQFNTAWSDQLIAAGCPVAERLTPAGS
jgi:hypothetical protein